jgi:hypothetical protein
LCTSISEHSEDDDTQESFLGIICENKQRETCIKLPFWVPGDLSLNSESGDETPRVMIQQMGEK